MRMYCTAWILYCIAYLKLLIVNLKNSPHKKKNSLNMDGDN